MAESPPPLGPATHLRRRDARAIWQAGVDAVAPQTCLSDAVDELSTTLPLRDFDRILVVGAGKAGAEMARVLENALQRHGVALAHVHGQVNVPNESVMELKAIRLHPSRPMGTNQPTPEALQGTKAILDLVAHAGPNDLLICLFSGGGSALMPAPVAGVSLADKQQVTAVLHGCGASIHEMNTVRKHLSQVKGGGLLRHFKGRRVVSFLISDVIGDVLDTIASGPTCVDPTTFADALAILERYRLSAAAGQAPRIPSAVLDYLNRGRAGQESETLKGVPMDASNQPLVQNIIVANNNQALAAAAGRAAALGYEVWNLGSYLDGETRLTARVLALLVRGLAEDRRRHWRRRRAEKYLAPGNKTQAGELLTSSFGQLAADLEPRPLCILSGGETTVTLTPRHGKGGRNQEFVLAMVRKLGARHLKGVTILCAGTDGEDGPTDAAGAIGDQALAIEADARKMSKTDYLGRHDAYTFFDRLGGLIKTGLTHTNVMDLRVILIAPD